MSAAPWDLGGGQNTGSGSGNGQVKMFDPTQFGQANDAPQAPAGASQGNQDGQQPAQAVGDMHAVNGGANQDPNWNQQWGPPQNMWDYNQHQQGQGYEQHQYPADQQVQNPGQFPQGDQAGGMQPEGWDWDHQTQSWQQSNQVQDPGQSYQYNQAWNPGVPDLNQDYQGQYVQQESYENFEQGHIVANDADGISTGTSDALESSMGGQSENSALSTSGHDVGMGAFIHSGDRNYPESQASSNAATNVPQSQNASYDHSMQNVPLDVSPQQDTGPPASSTPQMFASNSFSKTDHAPSPFDDIGAGGLPPPQQSDPSHSTPLSGNLGLPPHMHSRDNSFDGNVQFILGGSEPPSHNQSAEQSASASPDMFAPSRQGQNAPPPPVSQESGGYNPYHQGPYPAQTGAHAQNVTASPNPQADVLPAASLSAPSQPEQAAQQQPPPINQVQTPEEAHPSDMAENVALNEPPSDALPSSVVSPGVPPQDHGTYPAPAAEGQSIPVPEHDHQMNIYAPSLSTSPTSPFQPVPRVDNPVNTMPPATDNQEVVQRDRERPPSVTSSVSSHHSELTQLTHSNPMMNAGAVGHASLSPEQPQQHMLTPGSVHSSSHSPVSRQDSSSSGATSGGAVRFDAAPTLEQNVMSADHGEQPVSAQNPHAVSGNQGHSSLPLPTNQVPNQSQPSVPPAQLPPPEQFSPPRHDPSVPLQDMNPHPDQPQHSHPFQPPSNIPNIGSGVAGPSTPSNPPQNYPVGPASGASQGMSAPPMQASPGRHALPPQPSTNQPDRGTGAQNQPSPPHHAAGMNAPRNNIPPMQASPGMHPAPPQPSINQPDRGTGAQNLPSPPQHSHGIGAPSSNVPPMQASPGGYAPPQQPSIIQSDRGTGFQNQPHQQSGVVPMPGMSIGTGPVGAQPAMPHQQLNPIPSEPLAPQGTNSNQMSNLGNNPHGHHHHAPPASNQSPGSSAQATPPTSQPQVSSNSAPLQAPPSQQTQQDNQQPVPPADNPVVRGHSRKLSEDSIAQEIITSRRDPDDSRNNYDHSRQDSYLSDRSDYDDRRDRRDDRDLSDRDPRDPRDRDPRDPRDRDPRDPRDRDPRDPRDRDPRDPRDRDPRDPRDRDPRDPTDRDPRDPTDRDPIDPRERDPRDPRYRDPRDPRNRDPRYRDPRDRDYDRDYDRGYDRRDPYSRDDRRNRPQSRGYYDQGYPDDPYGRPRSRQGYPDDRPRSRQGFHDYDRQYSADYYGDRSRHGYPDERYDRPRSRQGYPDDRPPSRPSSRGPADRPSSRGPPERPSSRGPPERPSSRGPSERPHSRQSYSHAHHRPDPRNPPYDMKMANTVYYTDEFGKEYTYADYYRQQQQQQQQAYYDPRDPYGYQQQPGYDRYSRGYQEEMNYYNQQTSNSAYPQPAPGYPGQGDYDYDRRSQHSSQSRGNTPGPYGSGADAFAQEYQHGSRPSSQASGYGVDQSPIYPSADGTHHGYQDQSYDPSYPYTEPYAEPPVPQRMTPQKFTLPHCRASFGPAGQLVQVMPNNPADGQPATVIVQELDGFFGETSEKEELQTYPGPLTRTDSHKNDVLLFCQQNARDSMDSTTIVDRDSAVLLWRYLELLIKQNGTVVGTDIADLLLDGHQPPASLSKSSSVRSSESPAFVESSGDSATSVVHDRSSINKSSHAADEVTLRFRELLLHGRKKDALEWSMKQGLWGHALFLASKMDPKTHASIMTRFANSSMRMNDPLQTLFQLMSGRQPAAVTLVVDEKWGDWRPHLAMILSNQTSRPDLDKKSIITLGDTLASKGCLHASQFCYLMTQVPFGTYNKKSSKMVLIGSNHTFHFDKFANNKAIQCTEVYEYAQSLGNQTYVLPMFQLYKVLYAVRLAEHGLAEEALRYIEVVANTVLSNSGLYSAVLVRQLYELGNKLKYHDPIRLQSGEEFTDPQWLTQLAFTAQALENGSIQPIAENQTPYGNTSTRASSEVGEIMAGQTQMDGSTMQQSYNQSYNYQQAWDPNQSQQTWDPSQQQQQQTSQQQQQQTWDASQQAAWDQSQQAQQQQWQADGTQQQQQYTDPNAQQAQLDGSYLGYSQQQQQQPPATDDIANHQQAGGVYPQASADQTDGGNADLGASMNSQYTSHTGTTETEDDDNNSQLGALPPDAQLAKPVQPGDAGPGPKLEEYNITNLSTDLLDISLSLKTATTPPLPEKKKRRRKKTKKGLTMKDVDMETVKEIVNEQDLSESPDLDSSPAPDVDVDSDCTITPPTARQITDSRRRLEQEYELFNATEPYDEDDTDNEKTPRVVYECETTDEFGDLNETELADLVSDPDATTDDNDLLKCDILEENDLEHRTFETDEPGTETDGVAELAVDESIYDNQDHDSSDALAIADSTIEQVNTNTDEYREGTLTPTNEQLSDLAESVSLKTSRIQIGLAQSPLKATEMSFTKQKVCISPGHGRSYSEGYLQWSYIPTSVSSPVASPSKSKETHTESRRRRRSGRRQSNSSHNSGNGIYQGQLPRGVYFDDQRLRKLSNSSRSPPRSPRKRTTSTGSNLSSSSRNKDDLFKFGVPPPKSLMSNGSSIPLGASASNFSNNNAPPKKQAWPGMDEEEERKMAALAKKTDPKGSMSKSESKGWLSGIWNKISKNNEIKLPDDKNPTIVWDAVNNKWVDKDGNEEEEKPAAPPPKDSDLMGSPAPPTPAAPATPSGPPPPSGGNRFSLQKTRGARNQYVDVFGGKKASGSTPANLFNVMPKSVSMPANIYNPSAVDEAISSSSNNTTEQGSTAGQMKPTLATQAEEYQPQSAHEQPPAPVQAQPPAQQQFYNPSQYQQQNNLGVPDDQNISRSSSQSSLLSKEVQSYMQAPPQGAPAPAQTPQAAPPAAGGADPNQAFPQFFNPAAFNQGATPATTQQPKPTGTGGALRYGQRRAYPK